MEPVTEEEGQEMQDQLEQLAEEWRERLKDPTIRQQVQEGTLVVSPLVRSLLKTFPAQ